MKKTTWSIKNINLSILLGLIIFTYLVLRVVTVPISDDEYLTYREHVHQDVIIVLTNGNPNVYWAPNNHILNTLFLKLSFAIFGEQDWAFRVHILLAFVVCFYFMYRIISGFVASPVRQVAYLGILFLNPYLLDFFSIARGYAMSMAGWAAATYFFTRYYHEPAGRHLRNFLISLFLAIWANFSALYFLPVFGAMFLFLSIQNWQKDYIKPHFALFAGASVLIVAIIALPLTKSFAAGTLVWGSGSFFEDSIAASLDYYKHFNHHLGRFDRFNEHWTVTEVQAAILMAIWCIFQAIALVVPSDGYSRSLHRISLFQSIGIAAIVLLLNAFFNTPYPHHRTALLFAFPVLLSLFLALEICISRYKQLQYLLIPAVLFSSWHCAKSWNLENTMEWYQNGDAKRIFSFIAEEAGKSGNRKVYALGAEQWQYFSMAFYAETTYKDLVTLHFTKLDKDENWDYLYVPKHLKDQVWPAYAEAANLKHGILFRKK